MPSPQRLFTVRNSAESLAVHNLRSLLSAKKYVRIWSGQNTLRFMKQKGFTLVELLVVISIIGLLSSIVLAATKVARTESRDAKRVADIREIATALDFFYTQNNAYPYVNEVGSWAVAWADLATCLKTGVGCVNNGTQNIAAYVPVLANLPQASLR